MIEITENDIMKNWSRNISKPFVSIMCITYNHEKFIEKTIIGFLMQKTNFPFEVIIDDDASTDKTASIIKKYAEIFPTIIKPNIRKKNVGIYENGRKSFARTTGKYVAICDGDDYWHDTSKLQYQLDKMLKYPQCDISVHEIEIIADRPVKTNHFAYQNEQIISTSDFIKQLTPFQLSTTVIKRDALQKHHLYLEKNYSLDFMLQLFASLRGGILYIDKKMSHYRIHSGGITQKLHQPDYFHASHIIDYLDAIVTLNIYLQYKFEKELHDYINIVTYFYLSNDDFVITNYIKMLCKYNEHLYIENKKALLHKFILFLERDNYNAINALTPEQIDFIRDESVKIQDKRSKAGINNPSLISKFPKEVVEAINEPDIVFSYRLMKIAHIARPKGTFIKEKLEEYTNKLPKDKIEKFKKKSLAV